jgi:hypothetical protein
VRKVKIEEEYGRMEMVHVAVPWVGYLIKNVNGPAISAVAKFPSMHLDAF